MAVVEALDAAPGGRRRLRLRSPSSREPLGAIEVQTADDARAARRRRPGLFYAPTRGIDVAPDTELPRPKTFGPVLPSVRVRDEEEALRLANDSPYGLNGHVRPRDRRRGARLGSLHTAARRRRIERAFRPSRAGSLGRWPS